MRKPAFCICENKGVDQMRGNHASDQRLCFCYIDCTIPLLPNSEIQKTLANSATVQLGLCLTWTEAQKMGFLATWLI